ncbi:MAG: neutral zinc metallopeptidase [Proteobacteria bacterium]|nr:neutral zinc metallopeptidase [Pseudomonadota bacterium]
MRWEGNRESSNVEDDRGGGGGGGGGFGFGGGRTIGLGSVVIALVAGWIFGVNPLTILGLMSGGGGAPVQQQSAPPRPGPSNDPSVKFVSVVLASTEDVWSAKFQAMGRTYQPTKLRLYRGQEPTACGLGQSAMGPFYCPGDQKVYLDLGFFDTMRTRLGAPGEFAQAYVVAHEVGHHVQDLLGVTGKVDGMRGRLSETQQNALSVRVELQADCFAGIWAHDSQQSKQWLDQTDVESALNAASQIGDDTLQRKARGQVVPETFTHGTSAQRVAWFKRGLQNGNLNDCDTFQNRS